MTASKLELVTRENELLKTENEALKAIVSKLSELGELAIAASQTVENNTEPLATIAAELAAIDQQPETVEVPEGLIEPEPSEPEIEIDLDEEGDEFDIEIEEE